MSWFTHSFKVLAKERIHLTALISKNGIVIFDSSGHELSFHIPRVRQVGSEEKGIRFSLYWPHNSGLFICTISTYRYCLIFFSKSIIQTFSGWKSVRFSDPSEYFLQKGLFNPSLVENIASKIFWPRTALSTLSLSSKCKSS